MSSARRWAVTWPVWSLAVSGSVAWSPMPLLLRFDESSPVLTAFKL